MSLSDAPERKTVDAIAKLMELLGVTDGEGTQVSTFDEKAEELRAKAVENALKNAEE